MWIGKAFRLFLIFLLTMLCIFMTQNFVVKALLIKTIQVNRANQRLLSTPFYCKGHEKLTEKKQDKSLVELIVKNWLRKWVIEQKLCPWAAGVMDNKALQIVVFDTVRIKKALITRLVKESKELSSLNRAETETKVIVLNDQISFPQFLDITKSLEQKLRLLGLDQEIQVASFHPHYRFADSEETDVENFTNRAPFPLVHLLRVAGVAEAIEQMGGDTEVVWQRNVRRMRKLGREGLEMIHSEIIEEKLEQTGR